MSRKTGTNESVYCGENWEILLLIFFSEENNEFQLNTDQTER